MFKGSIESFALREDRVPRSGDCCSLTRLELYVIFLGPRTFDRSVPQQLVRVGGRDFRDPTILETIDYRDLRF